MDEPCAEASLTSTPTVDGEQANGHSPSNGRDAPSINVRGGTREIESSEQPQAETKTPSPSPPPPPPQDPKLCGVCHAQPGKYKCPRCHMPYCSVPCSKAHKENHPPDPSPSTAPSQVTSSLPTRPPPPDPFAILLEHAADFRKLFDRYPSLPSTLTRIQRATLPPPDLASTTTPGGLPWKLGPEHLPGGHKKQAEPWTRQVGLRNGAKALRQARTDPGEDGDGVREYCELVTYLLEKAKEQKAGEQARDVTAAVRAEVVAEETEVIRGLLHQERD